MKLSAVMLIGLAAVAGSAHAQLLAPPGTKATLTVEYEYKSEGKKGDKYDTNEWRVSRVANLTAEMVAQAHQSFPGLHKMDASQTADSNKKQARAEKAHKTMAPVMADMEKIAAKCGEDEACLEREIAQYGNNMQNPQELKSAGAEIAAASGLGAARYQMWSATAQKGTYSIDERARTEDSDPICTELPGARCTREETRKGGGALPLPPGMKPGSPETAGISLMEVDSVGKTMIVTLPIPLMGLGYTQTISTNKKGDTSGTSQQVMTFPPGFGKPMTIAITGDLRNQAGTQVIKLNGAREPTNTLDSTSGESGTLTVKWRFSQK